MGLIENYSTTSGVKIRMTIYMKCELCFIFKNNVPVIILPPPLKTMAKYLEGIKIGSKIT